jgi:hypothetical protein
MKNIEHPDRAPDPSYCVLLSVRQAYDTPQLFVCRFCRLSEKSLVQIKCPRCLRMMTRVEEAK